MAKVCQNTENNPDLTPIVDSLMVKLEELEIRLAEMHDAHQRLLTERTQILKKLPGGGTQQCQRR